MKIAILSLFLVAAACFTSSSAAPEIFDVQQKLRQILEDAMNQETYSTIEAVPGITITWTSLPSMESIGKTELRYPGTTSFPIPDEIPSTASNVLVYATVGCGYANRDSINHIKIYTQGESNQVHYEKYLFMHTWSQQAFNSNSENMWFPMPIDRRVFITVTKDAGPNCELDLYAVGYN